MPIHEAFARLLLISLIWVLVLPSSVNAGKPQWALAVHGGAGGLPINLPPAELQEIKDTLKRALNVGGQILATGGSSSDAVQCAVRVMENSGVLNAGRGAVLNHQGFAELDAALMDGRDRKAGSVAAVRHVANPIDLARLVMDRSRHVLIVGEGAERFAQEQGVSMMPEGYFITDRRKRELERVIEAEKKSLKQSSLPWQPMGTVGAVALDKNGNLAAATSTGGLTNKHFGRVGDSPIIGAGTYAENGVCAVSATGKGEYFIRYTAAADVCARIKYRNESVQTAAGEVIAALKSVGAGGGMIAMDANGNITMPYSTATMFRGQVSPEWAVEVIVDASAPKP